MFGAHNALHFDAEMRIAQLLLKDVDYEVKAVYDATLLGIREILLQQLSRMKGIDHFQEYYSFYIIWAESMYYGKIFHEQAAAWYKEQGDRANPVGNIP